MLFSSTIIATVGRPTLGRAVTSVLSQDTDPSLHEVIVVNDSGRELPHEPWMDDARVRVIATPRVERSAARNAGLAIARGEFVHILDDDDTIVLGSLAALRALATTELAVDWLYGPYETVDNDGNRMARFVPGLNGDIFAWYVAGESIPLQSSLLRRQTVVALGGFDAALVGVEDRDLGRRLAMRSLVASTSVQVASIRVGRETSTTDWQSLPERDRQARDKALSISGAAHRVRASAVTPFLRGRVARAYVGSALWNARRGRAWMAASRLVTAAWLGRDAALNGSFWRGMKTSTPDTVTPRRGA